MRSKSRVQDGIKYGLGYTLIVMLIGLIALEVFAQPLSAIFGLSGETETMCVQAMRIVSLSFLFAGANIAFQGIFQALDAGLQSLVISVCRQILFVLPVAWVFSLLARQSLDDMWLVWLTFLIAEGITALIGTGFMVQIHKKVIKTLAKKYIEEQGEYAPSMNPLLFRLNLAFTAKSVRKRSAGR